jgi:hypothetical protein
MLDKCHCVNGSSSAIPGGSSMLYTVYFQDLVVRTGPISDA